MVSDFHGKNPEEEVERFDKKIYIYIENKLKHSETSCNTFTASANFHKQFLKSLKF